MEASEELANWVVKGMQEKKAQEIVVMDLRGVHNAFTDFFVVCSKITLSVCFLNTKNITSFQSDLGIEVILKLFSNKHLQKI